MTIAELLSPSWANINIMTVSVDCCTLSVCKYGRLYLFTQICTTQYMFSEYPIPHACNQQQCLISKKETRSITSRSAVWCTLYMHVQMNHCLTKSNRPAIQNQHERRTRSWNPGGPQFVRWGDTLYDRELAHPQDLLHKGEKHRGTGGVNRCLSMPVGDVYWLSILNWAELLCLEVSRIPV